jgi:hypothetical protein
MTPHATQRDQRPAAAGESPASDYLGKRLIFFGAADNKTEPALLQLFSQHGEVAHLFIVRSALGISSGCGYVTYAAAEQARAALEALNGSTDCAEAGMTLGLLLVDEGSPSSSSSSRPGAAAADTGPPSAASSISSPKAGSTCSGANSQQEKLGKSVSVVGFLRCCGCQHTRCAGAPPACWPPAPLRMHTPVPWALVVYLCWGMQHAVSLHSLSLNVSPAGCLLSCHRCFSPRCPRQSPRTS